MLYILFSILEFKSDFRRYCEAKDIHIYSSSTNVKSFPIEIFNGILKTLIFRILSYERHKNFAKVLSRAVSIYNSTKSPSLNFLSPIEASKADNIVKLQEFLFKKRAAALKSRLNQKPVFEVNQLVRKTIHNPWNRVSNPRYSEKSYKISRIVKSGRPICYNLEGHGRKLFYAQQLTPVSDDHHESLQKKELLGIISSKIFVISRLRSGKITESEKRYLVRAKDDDSSPVYMTASDIREYDNGEALLKEYDSRDQ